MVLSILVRIMRWFDLKPIDSYSDKLDSKKYLDFFINYDVFIQLPKCSADSNPWVHEFWKQPADYLIIDIKSTDESNLKIDEQKLPFSRIKIINCRKHLIDEDKRLYQYKYDIQYNNKFYDNILIGNEYIGSVAEFCHICAEHIKSSNVYVWKFPSFNHGDNTHILNADYYENRTGNLRFSRYAQFNNLLYSNDSIDFVKFGLHAKYTVYFGQKTNPTFFMVRAAENDDKSRAGPTKMELIRIMEHVDYLLIEKLYHV